MIARTDLCPPGAGAACRLSIIGRANSFVCNAAGGGGAGGGLLFTKLAPGLVELTDAGCSGSFARSAFRDCLGAGLRTPPCKDAGGARSLPGSGSGSSPAAAGGRRLLAPDEITASDHSDQVAASDFDLVPLNAVGDGGYGPDVASAAATTHFEAVDGATLEALPDAAAASAAPGNPVSVRLRLRDQLGRNVTGRIADASMLMQVTRALGAGCSWFILLLVL